MGERRRNEGGTTNEMARRGETKGDIRSRIGITAVVLWTFGCHDGNHNGWSSTRSAARAESAWRDFKAVHLGYRGRFSNTYVRFCGKMRRRRRACVSVRSFSRSRTHTPVVSFVQTLRSSFTLGCDDGSCTLTRRNTSDGLERIAFDLIRLSFVDSITFLTVAQAVSSKMWLFYGGRNWKIVRNAKLRFRKRVL